MTERNKTDIKRMFDRIAPSYDRLNHLLSAGIDRSWRRRTARRVSRTAPHDIADIAAGTGDLSIALARRMPAAHITGIDLSDEMLAVGREKIRRRGLDEHISLQQGDGENLPFSDASFDAVTIAFGIRNFADREAGLHEALRILRPGGHLYILEFSMPKNPLFAPIYKLYFRNAVPAIGKIISKDENAYDYLPHSVEQFPEKLLFLQMMEGCGFAECRMKNFMFGIAILYEGVKK